MNDEGYFYIDKDYYSYDCNYTYSDIDRDHIHDLELLEFKVYQFIDDQWIELRQVEKFRETIEQKVANKIREEYNER